MGVGECVAAKHEMFFVRGMVEADREVVFSSRIGGRCPEIRRAVAVNPSTRRGKGIQVQNLLGCRPYPTPGCARSAGQNPPARLQGRHAHEYRAAEPLSEPFVIAEKEGSVPFNGASEGAPELIPLEWRSLCV